MSRLSKRARLAICAALLLMAFVLLACTGDPGCVQVADQHPARCVDP